jgi:hypothetical protein
MLSVLSLVVIISIIIGLVVVGNGKDTLQLQKA